MAGIGLRVLHKIPLNSQNEMESKQGFVQIFCNKSNRVK